MSCFDPVDPHDSDMRYAPLQISRLNTEQRLGNETIVARIVDGDEWAMEALYQRYVHKITGIVAKLLRNSSDIEDTVQDTFIQAFQDIKKLREPAYLERWLVRIAVHRVHRRFRKRDLLRKLGLDRSVDNERLHEQIGIPATQEIRAELALLDTAFDMMKMPERVCFVLRYLEGYQLDEVARATDASLATVKRRITKAKQIVQHHFEEVGHG